VLIVDDNATNRRIVEEWLRAWKMKPLAVDGGAAAMDALCRAASRGRPYPLALLDARMPETDGLTLAAEIRQRDGLADTRLILLTSGEIAQSGQLPVDAHLVKPLHQEELFETIYRVLARDNGKIKNEAIETAPSADVTAVGPQTSSVKVLVAEDDPFSAQLLEHLLLRRGHRVQMATTGGEALRLAKGGGFDLMLLDMHMPELDGFQVAKAVRQSERATGDHLPIIALTARSRKEDREKCLSAGMDEFLSKPVAAADLWTAIDRVASPRRPAEPSGVGLLDPQVLLAACGGDASLLEKLGQALKAQLPDRLNSVKDALRDGDAPRLREAAHKLCGMVAAFSTSAGHAASELEERAAHGQLEEARPLVARLESMADELIGAVDRLSLDALRAQAD
jgi:CheY-like chemotaxis protein